MISSFLDLSTTTLEYASFGKQVPGQPLFLLLHEGLGCVGLWKHFPSQLAQSLGSRVDAYSRQGYGRSSAIHLPRPYNYLEEQSCIELKQVLDELRQDKVILIGHSDGATIALAYAAQYDDPRIHGVVAMAPHVFAEPCCIDAISATTQRYREGNLQERLKRYHGSNVDGAFYGWSDTWRSKEFAHWNMTHLLKGLKGIPLLLIQGEQDEYASDEHIHLINRYSMNVNTTVWLPECGHVPHFESPEETRRAIVDFVTRLEEA